VTGLHRRIGKELFGYQRSGMWLGNLFGVGNVTLEDRNLLWPIGDYHGYSYAFGREALNERFCG